MKKVVLLSLLFLIPLSAQDKQYSLLMLESKSRIINPAEINLNATPAEEILKKNAGLAIVYSLLLPGMGELYAGAYSSGKYFTIAEGVLWGSYLGINTYGGWLKDRYMSYAVSSGGVNPSGKDEDYYAIIGEYRNIQQYNTDQALDRNFKEIYDENTHYWNWDTEQDRRRYRNMWVSSEQAYNSLRFVAGALIVNRIASAINAVRLVAAHNKRVNTQTSWNLSLGVINHPGIPSGLTINFNKEF